MFLVTGGAGFIGSNIVAALAARGSPVVVCDRLHTDARWRNLAKHEINDLIAPEELSAWLERHGERLEGVVHMGAITATDARDVGEIVRNNVRLSLDLFHWCAAHERRFIYASSAATYGDGSHGFDDDASRAALARLRPLNPYGWSKHVVDRAIARAAADGAALPTQWVGLKFFNVYGPNEYHKGAMQSLIARSFASVRAGELLRLFRSQRVEVPDGGQKRDFVYVDDCVEVIEWLIDHPKVSGLFNLGTGQARTWLDLARALFRAAEREERVEFIDMPAGLAAHYQYYTEARMERLIQAGYNKPFTSLEAGITCYVRDYLGTGDPYR